MNSIQKITYITGVHKLLIKWLFAVRLCVRPLIFVAEGMII